MCLMYAHGYNLRFSGKNQQNTNYFVVGHILRLFVIFVGHI